MHSLFPFAVFFLLLHLEIKWKMGSGKAQTIWVGAFFFLWSQFPLLSFPTEAPAAVRTPAIIHEQ